MVKLVDKSMEEKYLKIIEAAKAGGQVVRQYFGQDLKCDCQQ